LIRHSDFEPDAFLDTRFFNDGENLVNASFLVTWLHVFSFPSPDGRLSGRRNGKAKSMPTGRMVALKGIKLYGYRWLKGLALCWKPPVIIDKWRNRTVHHGVLAGVSPLCLPTVKNGLLAQCSFACARLFRLPDFYQTQRLSMNSVVPDNCMKSIELRS
jgi:hypothetical protein